MKKFINDLEVVENAIIHIHDNQEVKIMLSDNLILRFAFRIDDEDKKAFIKQKLNGDRDLTIECFNFTNSLGEGILKPFKIGTFNNKNLYVSFFMWTTNSEQGMRIFTYNIYTQI